MHASNDPCFYFYAPKGELRQFWDVLIGDRIGAQARGSLLAVPGALVFTDRGF